MFAHSLTKSGVLIRRGCVPLKASKNDPPTPEKKVKLERGFRWDPSLQRWIEEKRLEGQEFPEEGMKIKTKTGDEYTVRSSQNERISNYCLIPGLASCALLFGLQGSKISQIR